MKKFLLCLALALSVSAQEVRLGATVDVPTGLGYTTPRVGPSLSADFLKKRFWLSTETRMLWASKQDGGSGYSLTTEGIGHLRLAGKTYLGAGVTYTRTDVKLYSKDALHPSVEFGYWFNPDKNRDRDWLVTLRYMGSGDDRRNHLQDYAAGLRLPLGKRWSLDQNYAFVRFHGTDKPTERYTGFDIRWTVAYTIK